MGIFINNRYKVEDQIGQGGMGMVFKAQDRLTQQPVALKLVSTPAEELEFASRQPEGVDVRLMLTQEFKILASLHHPNIIRVLDYGFTPDRQPYYTMDWLENAQTLYEAGVGEPFSTQAQLLVQVFQALDYLHRRDIIHRDIKPNNVLVVNGQVKVLDFGLAASQENIAQRQTSHAAGTLAYMAPELLRGKPPSPASDLYAVGIIGYMMASTQHPFNVWDLQGLIDDILNKPAAIETLDINERYRQVLGRLLAKDPADRYTDARELARLYAQVLDHPEQYETANIRDSFLQAAQFVGRNAELAQLTDALQAAMQGTGSAWLVGGESGVGKSRLIEELRTQALVEGALVLRGQAIAEGGAPYLLWRDVMRYLCLQTDLHDLEASVLKLLVPELDTLLQRHVEDAPEIDVTAAQVRLLNVIEAVFKRQTQPIVILLEDLQWAQESLTILRRLNQIVGAMPLLIVASYRDDEKRTLPEELPAMHLLSLKRLQADAIADLSASMLGGEAGRQSDVVELIQRESEGNVFFIVEVVRALAEDAGRLDLVGQVTLPEQVFARGVQSLMQRRLQRVPAAAQGLLQLAAVAGRELDLAILRPLADGLPLEEWLHLCGDAAVLEVSGEQWRFAHDKLREAILSDLSVPLYRSLHQRVAATIEQVYPQDPTRYAVLAYLWGAAQNPRKEAHYAGLAGQEALAKAAYHEAVKLLARAAELTEDPHERGELLHHLGETYFGMGQLDDVRLAAEEAVQILGKGAIPRTPAALRWQFAREVLRQVWHRIKHPNKPPANADQLRIAARSCEVLLMSHYFRNEKFRVGYYALRGLNLAEQAGLAGINEQGRSHSGMVFFLGLVQQHRFAPYYLRRAKALGDEINEVKALTWMNLILGVYATGICDWDTAQTTLERCIELADKVGYLRRWEEGLLSLAAVYYFHGIWDKSAALGKQIYESGLRQGNVQGVAWGLDDIGRVALRQGEMQQALELFNQSETIYEEITDITGKVWVRGALAQAHWRLGDQQKALAYAAQGKALLTGTAPGAYGLLEGYHGVADVYLRQLETNPQTQSEAQEALDLLGEYAAVFDLGKAMYGLHRCWFYWLTHQPALALKTGEQAAATAKRLGQPYEEGLAYYHMGRFLPKDDPRRAEYLQKAIQLFEGIKARWDSGQARIALVDG